MNEIQVVWATPYMRLLVIVFITWLVLDVLLRVMGL